MKKQLIYIVLALPLLTSSCSDWLDVQPDASIDRDKLFEKEEGFFEAINGIYSVATDYSLYGGLFSMELTDAMMQNYSFGSADYTQYAKTAAFDFTDQNCRDRLESIWTKAYSAIVNCNLVLENVDRRREIFHEGMYEIVKGEALAMRAYLHLDMLRFFGPVYSVAPGAAAIPYVTTYSNLVTPISTVSQVLDYIIRDLGDAKLLLESNDPITGDDYVAGYLSDAATTEEDDPELFLQNRRHRMNYYAVCGTLARALLIKGEYTDAAELANEVILSGKFKWAAHSDLRADADGPDRDRIMYPELVFAWYNEKNKTELDNRFNAVATGYYVNKSHAEQIYEYGLTSVGDEDIRREVWFTVPTSNSDVYKIIKYLRNPAEIGNKHYLVMPGIRLSEMWYIVAECAYRTGDEPGAWDDLNHVRETRGIRVVLDRSYDFDTELLKEYRKETFAEGQAFLQYKRLHRNIVGESAFYTPAQGIYNPPLPDSETEHREER